MKKEIFGLTPEELQQEFVAAGLKKFRASQVYQWLYKKCVFKFEEMHNLSVFLNLRRCTISPRQILPF